QQVLHYSALKTGVAYVALTLSIIGFSAVSQALATRIGIRRVLPIGMLLSAAGLVLYAQLPVHGHYFWDLFPAFLLSGIGLALAFVPMSIGALTGVRQSQAGIASGLINTSQQIGGAIGVAAATTIATTVTGHYVSSHPGATALGARSSRTAVPATRRSTSTVRRSSGCEHASQCSSGKAAARTAPPPDRLSRARSSDQASRRCKPWTSHPPVARTSAATTTRVMRS